MIIQSGPSTIACILLACTPLAASCQTNQGNPPNIQQLELYSIEVDHKIFRLQIPSGGVVGKFNVDHVDTSAIHDEFFELFYVDYDLLATTTKYYSLTSFRLGLTKKGCCGIDELLAYAKIGDEAGKTVAVYRVEDESLVRTEIVGSNKKNFAIYYLPYNENFSFYFTVRLREEAAGNSEFVRERFEMLDEIVANFARMNKRLLKTQ